MTNSVDESGAGCVKKLTSNTGTKLRFAIHNELKIATPESKNTLFDVSFVSIRFNVSRFSDEPGFVKIERGKLSIISCA